MFRRPSQHHTRTHRSARIGRPALAAVVVACAGLVVFVAACTGDSDAGPSEPSSTSFSLPPLDVSEQIPTVTVPDGFVLIDTRGARITPFESNPKTTREPLAVRGGGAVISGRVTGPDGPVAGASVLLERVVGDQTGSIVVATRGDGQYQAAGIHGGKYRVRAWSVPTLASRASTLVYLADLDGRATADLGVDLFTGRSLQVGLDVTAVNVGGTAQVRALLTDQVVDENGIVTGQAIASAEVRLSGSGSMDYDNAVAMTNPQGFASWSVTCAREGTTTFTASTEGAVGSFTSPSCGPKPTTTTTTTVESVEVPNFPIGQEFDVPRGAALPAGSYATFLNGCKTTFEVYANGSWQSERRTVSGPTMVLPGPGRDFRAAGDTKGCTYRRQS